MEISVKCCSMALLRHCMHTNCDKRGK
jgi:hypothetical protein